MPTHSEKLQNLSYLDSMGGAYNLEMPTTYILYSQTYVIKIPEGTQKPLCVDCVNTMVAKPAPTADQEQKINFVWQKI